MSTHRRSAFSPATAAVAFVAAGLIAGPAAAAAQSLSTPTRGPMIEGYGPVFAVPDADFAPTDMQYRLVFDVVQTAEEPDQVNRRIETLARFLNMHAAAGVPAENMSLALVVHGSAGKDLLDHAGYQARYGVDNPNVPLLEALADAGVEIYICGQTAYSRGLPKSELAEPVQMALSAMTALAAYQAKGYGLIAF